MPLIRIRATVGPATPKIGIRTSNSAVMARLTNSIGSGGEGSRVGVGSRVSAGDGAHPVEAREGRVS